MEASRAKVRPLNLVVIGKLLTGPGGQDVIL